MDYDAREIDGLFFDFFDGKVGTVIKPPPQHSDGIVEFQGELYKIGDEVGNIDENLLDDDKQLFLIKSDGPRGEGCYSGFLKMADTVYWLNIANGFSVYELIPLA